MVTVKQAFWARNIPTLLNPLARRKLQRYPKNHFDAIMAAIDMLQKKGFAVKDVSVPPPETINDLEKLDFARIPDDLWASMLDNATLDLGKIEQTAKKSAKLPEQAPPLPSQSMIMRSIDIADIADVTTEVREILDSLPDNTTIEGIIESIREAIGKLDFQSILVYSPGEAPNWNRPVCFSSEVDETTKYDHGIGRAPEGTLKSVIECEGKTILIVDYTKPETFSTQGLYFDQSVAEHYQARGNPDSPTQMIYLRIKHPMTDEVLAVMVLHNIVPRGKTAPAHLLPSNPKAKATIMSQLGSLSELIGNRLARAQMIHSPKSIELPKEASSQELSLVEKREILAAGERKYFQGHSVRVFEFPAEKFYRKIGGVINWLRGVILAVYDGTVIANGKTRQDLIAALSLEDELMMERVVFSRYTVLIEGSQNREDNLQGIVSFNVFDVEVNGEKRFVLKVPEAMIRKEVRGNKLTVALTNEIGKRFLLKYWFDNGLFKGFWKALIKGIPIYATTQSKRVIKDMSRLSGFSVLRLAKGMALTREQQAIVAQGSSDKADNRGVEPEAYGGRIAIDEEEENFKIYGGKTDKAIDDLLAQAGERGRLHLIGYLNLWVGIKTTAELFFKRRLKALWPRG